MVEFDRLLNLSAARADRSTVAIISFQGLPPKQHGTGTLFRFGGVCFLVSAAHVLLDSIKAGVPLALFADNGQSMHLTREDAVYTEEFQSLIGEEDPFDLAVWRLSPEIVGRLSHKQFLLQTDIDFNPDLSAGEFLVYGYPTLWSSPSPADGSTIEQAPIAIRTVRYYGTKKIDKFREQYHCLLNYAGLSPSNEAGETVPPPDSLSGISGCSIWKLHNEGVAVNDWDENFAKVIAIQTNASIKHGAIRGTKWQGVLTIILDRWPELRAGFSLHLPGKR